MRAVKEMRATELLRLSIHQDALAAMRRPAREAIDTSCAPLSA
jgi:hypothetical protein